MNNLRVVFLLVLIWWWLPVFGGMPVGFEWSETFALPAAESGAAAIGVGGPFFGEHNGMALLAGGSNFPDTPLKDGGKKKFHDTIYVLSLNSTNWLAVGKLSIPAAEGVSITTDKGVVCIGGNNSSGALKHCVLLSWNAQEQRVVEELLPEFPAAIFFAGGGVRGRSVFVVGGKVETSLPSSVWTLDLDKIESGWTPMPSLPESNVRIMPQVFVQNGSQKKTFLYVVGGYANHKDGGHEALFSGYAYDLEQHSDAGVWQPISPPLPQGKGKHLQPLIGATALISGDQHVLFFGGLDAEYFNDNQRKMTTLKGKELEQHITRNQSVLPANWNRSVLVYHTVTDRWFELGEVPWQPVVLGAAIRRDNGSILLSSGEIRPGVRTPLSINGKLVMRKKFHTFNWVVIGGYFFGLALMGWWFSRKQKSADDYFKGGGRIPWWAAGISIFAAMFSSITFLAIPALVYNSDWSYFPKVFPFIVIPPIVISFYLPFFRKLNLTSAYEYLELRFNLACRLFASLAFNLFMIARVAVVSYLPALAVAAATGADVNLCIIIVCLLTILYCAFGGIEAVIWSDVVQGAVLLGGALLIIGILLFNTDGGFSGFIAANAAAHKFHMLDLALDFSKPVIWVVLIGGFAEVLITYTSDQCVIQRYMTTKDIKAAGRSLWLNVPLGLLSGIIFFTIGSALYSFYHSHPEQLAVNMPKPDSILPMFMAHGLPVGVAGLVLAGLFAATITTLAANLNSSATAWTTDFVVRLRRSPTSDGARVRIAQYITVAVGLAGMFGALALANMEMRAVYDQFLKFIGILTSGLACLFMLGIFARRVGSIAAIAGLTMNYVVCIGLNQMSLSWKPHLLLYGVIGIVTCWITAMVVSLVFPNRKEGIQTLMWQKESKGEETQS